MKLTLTLILIIYCSSVFGLSITYPEPKLVQFDEAWKYGIKRSTKVIDDVTYLSITVDPRLLCDVKKASSTAWLHNQTGHELEVLRAVGAFTVKFKQQKYSRVEFLISCKEESKVHRGFLFKYRAWESPIA